MKVLYITNLPSPYRVEFFTELGKLCDLTVIYERKSASDRSELWRIDDKYTYKSIYLNGFELGTDNSISFKIIKYLNNKYDYIIVGMYSTLTAMIAISYMNINKIPFVLSTDGGFINEDNKIKYNIKRYFISSAKWWLSTGKLANKYLINYGADKNKISIYPFTSLNDKDISNNILEENEKSEIRLSLGIYEKKVIIAVGQFIHRKGFDLLLKACNSIGNDVGVYIIGGNATKEYLEIKQRYKLKNIHFLEFMKKEKLNEYYKASDIFVLPTREDVWGLVINEAMAKALPIITTDKCLAGNELVRNNINGYIIESDNVEELKSKINLILENEKIRGDMGKESLKIIEKYTISKMALKHIEVLKELGSL